MRFYKIDEATLRDLLAGAHHYWALENGGVDNWMWESDSRNDYIDTYNNANGTNYEDIEEIVEAEICDYTLLP